jgi:hypothetical protein
VNGLSRALAAFGRFWWDFLVGDTPELFVATLVLVGIALGFGHSAALRPASVPVLLVAVVGFLSLSTWRGRKRA